MNASMNVLCTILKKKTFKLHVFCDVRAICGDLDNCDFLCRPLKMTLGSMTTKTFTMTVTSVIDLKFTKRFRPLQPWSTPVQKRKIIASALKS